MSQAELIIHKPGLYTTVQDNGRYGYQRFGMPVAGVMDPYAYHLANQLVGNTNGEACLETTLLGPEIEFTASCVIALTGADMSPCLNGEPVQRYAVLTITAGDRLTCSAAKYGCRMYIAVAGGIDVPKVMNSRSTYVRASTGGLDGRTLKTGDRLPIGKQTAPPMKCPVPHDCIPQYARSTEIRIVPGPEAPRFTFEGICAFLTSEYTVTAESDRMGYRLNGPVITHRTNADIISAGIAPGTIQIPGNGQPIILLADRQTTGGYTRIAQVITVDLSVIAQMKPGDTLRFREVSLETAHCLLRERTQSLHRVY